MSELTPQTPAEGILKVNDFGDMKFYKVACSCGNSDDEITLEVESSDGHVTVHLWTKVKTPWWRKTWKSDNYLAELVNGFTHRVKMTWKLWVNGYLEQESWTLLNRQQALNFSETIKQAIKDVEDFRNKKSPKS